MQHSFVFTTDDLKPFFEEKEYSAGQQLVQDNCAVSIEPDLFSFKVDGVFQEGRHLYQASVSFHQNDKGALVLEGACQCPFQPNCRHVAALAIFTQQNIEQSLDAEVSETGRMWLSLLQEKVASPAENATDAPEDDNPYHLIYTVSLDEESVQIRVFNVCRDENGAYSMTKPISIARAARGAHKKSIRPVDPPILRALFLHLSDEQQLSGEGSAALLQQIISTGRARLTDPRGTPLWMGDNRTLSLGWQLNDDATQSLGFTYNGASDIHCRQVFLDEPLCINVRSGETFRLETPVDADTMKRLESLPPVDPADSSALAKAIPQTITNLPLRVPGPAALGPPQDVSLSPTPVLRLAHYHGASVVSLNFRYGRTRIDALSPEQSVYCVTRDGQYCHSPRDFHAEETFFSRLSEHVYHYKDSYDAYHASADASHASPMPDRSDMEDDEPATGDNTWVMYEPNAFAEQIVPELLADGWVVEYDDDWTLCRFLEEDADQQWAAHVEHSGSGIDWFSVGIDISVNGEIVPLLPLLVAMLRRDNLTPAMIAEMPDDTPVQLPLGDQRFIVTPIQKIRTLLLAFLELHYGSEELDELGRLTLNRFEAHRVASLSEDDELEHLRWLGEEELFSLGRQLKDFSGLEPVALPSSFQGQLRPYQQEGLDWMGFLRQINLGGILADEMGLGKTVQSLALLDCEKQSGRQVHPNLVVATTSLIVNWANEARKFTPHLKVLVLHGLDRMRLFKQIQDADIVLTTYGSLRRDALVLAKERFHYVILDEAHHIKNPASLTSRTVRRLQAAHRLALSGTPIENHLGELWSIIDFLNPGVLGTQDVFRVMFRNPIENQGDTHRMEFLKKRVSPLMLRRVKKDVVKELPDKTYIVKRVPLTNAQKHLYESVRMSGHSKVREVIQEKGYKKSQITILSALLLMRQVCCDPRLVKMKTAKEVKESAKLKLLMEMLDEMLEDGRRILLFSQFTSMLELIEQELVHRSIEYVKLTGQTKDRATPLRRFQDKEVPLFLVSLKAGGVGLNLTAADTVIHYDPWWNPSAEDQATDRAHRIGQTEPVFVYKLIAEGTIEERMLELQDKKRQIAQGLFSSETSKDELFGPDDLDALFQPLA